MREQKEMKRQEKPTLRSILRSRIKAGMFALCSAAVFMASNASAQSYIPLEDLKQQVANFTYGHYHERYPDYDINLSVTKLDSRTRLQQCQEPLQLEAPRQLNRSGSSLISVSCVGPVPWRMFVPVKVNIHKDVLVAAGPIARNSEISASNTRSKQISLTSVRNEYVTDIGDVSGMVAKRSFRDGQPIIVGQLTTPTLVKRGDAVVISAKAGSTQVKISGIAQAAGKKGEQILVKNSHSNRTLKAMVIGRGRVAVTL